MRRLKAIDSQAARGAAKKELLVLRMSSCSIRGSSRTAQRGKQPAEHKLWKDFYFYYKVIIAFPLSPS